MPYKEELLVDGHALTPGIFSFLRKIVYGSFPYTCVVAMGFDECEVTHEAAGLDGVDELERSFGRPSNSCPGENTQPNSPSESPNSPPESPPTSETSGVSCPMKYGRVSGAVMLFITLALAAASF